MTEQAKEQMMTVEEASEWLRMTYVTTHARRYQAQLMYKPGLSNPTEHQAVLDDIMKDFDIERAKARLAYNNAKARLAESVSVQR